MRLFNTFQASVGSGQTCFGLVDPGGGFTPQRAVVAALQLAQPVPDDTIFARLPGGALQRAHPRLQLGQNIVQALGVAGCLGQPALGVVGA